MDLITHGVLGAAVALGLARKHEIKHAAAIGCLAAILPDADTLIQSAEDSLLRLEYHRQFTHSLIFLPIGSLLAALLFRLLLKQELSFLRIYLFTLAAYASALFLDTCTSYGTQLLWPFSGERVAWRIVSIVDPLVTIMLIMAVALSLAKRSSRSAAIGIALVVAYFSVGLMQRGIAEQQVYALAKQRGHDVARLEVKPTMANLLLWRSVYQSGDYYYVDAIRLGPVARTVYPGGAVKVFDVAEEFPSLQEGSVLFRDIRRFHEYSDGYVVRHPTRPSLLGDIRYAMLPNSLAPLWGIETGEAGPEQHARYEDVRDVNAKKVEIFLDMLAGSYAVDVALDSAGQLDSGL